MVLYLSLTHNCQLRCDYCYAGEKLHQPMSKETLLKSIEFTLKLPMKKLEFGFFGGEPLMEWELFQFATYEVERQTQQRGIELVKTVTTNGVLLDSTKVAWLRKHGFYVVVSLDGNEAMHHTHRRYANGSTTFHTVKKGLQELQKRYNVNDYAVISVVTPQNIQHLPDSVAYLHQELGIQHLHLALDYFATWGEETTTYRDLYHQVGAYALEQYQQGNPLHIDIIDDKIRTVTESNCQRCSFGEFKLAVAPSGRLYPCERLIGNDTGALSMGDVYQGFDHTQRAKMIEERGNSNKECQTCPIKERCTNSCGCTNYTLTNSINTTNGTVCFFQKLFIEVADKVASTLYEEKNEMFMGKFYAP